MWILLIILLVSQTIAEFWLERINNRAIQINAKTENQDDPQETAKTIEYTLSKSYFTQIVNIYSFVTLLIVLWSSVLPWFYQTCTYFLGQSIWAETSFIMGTGFLFAILQLPFDWYYQFRLEERFGFNTSTQSLWWMDKLKGILLSLILLVPLLALIFKVVMMYENYWWLYAWLIVIGFQVIMMIIGPSLILPLFNKFTPLPDGNLKQLISETAEKSNVEFCSILVMDGSKRSRHSNAFFTGIGRFKKIALFDTLLEHLEDNEIQSVVAHEIGHLKKKHIPKQVIWSSLELLAGFYVAYLLLHQSWLVEPFGFEPGAIAPAFFMLFILGSAIFFWISPLFNLISRKYEYEADRFAKKLMGEGQTLLDALKKLHKKNLSDITPHPVYSAVYYSHPTLKEREKALQKEGES